MLKCHIFSFSNRTIVLLLWTLLSSGQFVLGEIEKPAAQRPNFILILSDDQGWNGTSVPMDKRREDSRSDYHQTPNLERLARSGMRFSNGYAPSCVCAPTRYSIQFGQTPARLQMTHVGMNTDHIDHNQLTVPKLLKKIDPRYAAAHFGKWHIEADPEDLGYDASDGRTRNSHGGMSRDKWIVFKVAEDPKLIFSLTRRGMDFMERQTELGRPFYLQISHYATHADIVSRASTLKKYERLARGEVHKIPAFAAMTEDLDTSVGMVLDKLRALGIEESTYILYMSDNGAVPKIPPKPPTYARSCNHPLARGKWDLMEGGIRVPFIISGPGIAPDSQCDVPVAGWDLMPTFFELAGGQTNLPDNLDGGSVTSLLQYRGKGTVERRNQGFVFHFPHRNGSGLKREHSAIRIDRWKLLRFWDNNQRLLFDLEQDIGETNDLAAQRPDKADALEAGLLSYLKQVNPASIP